MAIVKNQNGVTICTMKTSNSGAMKGYCGQELKKGLYAVYADTVGICSVKKAGEAETVITTGVLMPIEKIESEILGFFKNHKKLAVMTEKTNGKETLQVLEIPVNKSTIPTILSCLSLNTVKKKNGFRCGVVLRDIKDNIEKLATIGCVVLEFPASELERIADEYAESGANNGNFAEYLLSGNEQDILKRFRSKKNDVLVKLDAFKQKRRWELKTTLKYTNKAVRSGASNTNMLTYFTESNK